MVVNGAIHSQAALAARLAQAASQVVARKGMAGAWRPGPGRPRKGLVPASSELGPSQQRALQMQSRRLRTDMSPEQKHALCRQLQVLFKETGSSRRTVFAHKAGQIGCTPTFVRRCWDNRQVWENKVLAQASRPTATQVVNPQTRRPEQRAGRKANGAQRVYQEEAGRQARLLGDH